MLDWLSGKSLFNKDVVESIADALYLSLKNFAEMGSSISVLKYPIY